MQEEKDFSKIEELFINNGGDLNYVRRVERLCIGSKFGASKEEFGNI